MFYTAFLGPIKGIISTLVSREAVCTGNFAASTAITEYLPDATDMTRISYPLNKDLSIGLRKKPKGR